MMLNGLKKLIKRLKSGKGLIFCIFLFLGVMAGAGVMLYGRQPKFSITVHESVQGIIRPYAESLAKEINKKYPLERNYTLYAANFEENSPVANLKGFDNSAILWLGSNDNFVIDGIEKFGTVFASTPLLSGVLGSSLRREIAFLPVFVPLREQMPENKQDKFFAIIGNPPYVENLLSRAGIFYKKYSREERRRIFDECFNFKGAFVEDTAFVRSSLDMDPALLAIAKAGVPIGIYWSWPHKEEAINAFNDRINFYMYSDDAAALIYHMAENPANSEVLERAKEAKELVLEYYDIKAAAKFMVDYLNGNNNGEREVLQNTINLDIPVAVGHTGSGDFWLARDLKEALSVQNKSMAELSFFNSLYKYRAEVNILVRGFMISEWDSLIGDFNIFYLAYPQFGEDNDKELMLEEDEYIKEIREYILTKRFDAFVSASPILADKLNQNGVKAYYVPQFTNVRKFYPDYDEKMKSEVLFVGMNAFYRYAAKAVLDAGLPIDIYGPNWNGLAKAPYVDNRILRKYYASAKIVLNDTREGMKKFGFISNRIFDVTASGGFVISDYMKEIEEIYGDSVPMYKTKEELVALVKYYLDPEHEEERKDKARRAREITLENFTSDKAAERFLEIIKEIK